MQHWKGVDDARWIAEHSNPNAETALETLGRFTCIEFALPRPVCNAWVGAEGRPEVPRRRPLAVPLGSV